MGHPYLGISSVWTINWYYAMDIGILATLILFILKVFENPRNYNYYRWFWLFTLLMLYWTTLKKEIDYFGLGIVVPYILKGILLYLVTITLATYQYRKKAGILRGRDTLLFGVAIILCGFYSYSDAPILWSWSELKHSLGW
jgi:hypothetical protein